MVEEARSHSSAETSPAAAGAAAAGAMNHRPHFAKDPEEKKQEEDAVVVVVAAEEERRKRRKVERHGGVERDASGGGGGREEVVDGGGGGGGGGGDARDDEAHWDAAAAAAAAADTKEEKDRELNGYVDGDDDNDEEQGVRGQTKEGEQGEHVNALSSSGDDEIENDGAEDVFKSPAPVHSPPIKKIRLIPSRRRRERSLTTATDPSSSSSSSASARCWQPNRYLEPSKPPPDESIKLQQYQVALKAAEKWNGGVDFAGRPPKLLKPRRTVDYMAEVGRMRIVSFFFRGTRDLEVTSPKTWTTNQG